MDLARLNSFLLHGVSVSHVQFVHGCYVLRKFKIRIASPVANLYPVAPNIVLELLPLPALELVQLLHICKPLSRFLELVILTVDGFSEQLFGADLDGRGRLVLGSVSRMRTWLEIKTLTLTRGGPRELSMVGSGCVVNVQRLGVESPKKSWGSLGRVGRQATRTCKGPRQACNFTLGRITLVATSFT